ncbi:hypothetical protein DCC81_22260 [Chitinophaga parva]|uniref:DUF4252 domain-containing protein n=1 Tax=Chitinophaga parva TaxID=2169414 RepID=A0A2T7BDF4_9BACT|nr:DUF4252 domain-containing protein [Chitinophaga parva]PUZ23128.1 hypothetical protein DCC81_22260 [Chitinophaga parva]
MRNKLLILGAATLLSLAATMPAQAQNKALRQFCREYRGQAEIHTFAVGRPLLALASWVIPNEDEDTRVVKHLLHHLRRVKLYVMQVDSDAKIDNSAMARLKASLEKAHFESLADVKSKDAVVHVMSDGKPEDLGNVVLAVKSETDVVFVSLRTNLKLQEVADVINKYALSDLHLPNGRQAGTKDNNSKPEAPKAVTAVDSVDTVALQQ